MKRTMALLALTALLLLPAAALATTGSAGLVRFDVLELHAAAGASSVMVQVDRTGGSAGSVSVKYTIVAGTAVAGHDFTLTSGQLAWADGDATPKSFSIAVAPTANSAGKTVFLGLYDPFGGATTDPATRYATLILAGGSGGGGGAGVVRFDQAEFHAVAGATSVSIQVDRNGGSTGAVSVKYTIAAGTAIAGHDFTLTSGQLNWADGDATPKSFSITVAPTANSAGKTVLLGLYDPFGGATTDPTLKYATLILAGGSGGGGSAGVVRFDQAEFHAAASATSASIQVDRTGGSAGAVSVKYTIAAGTALAGHDFTLTSGQLNWADGDATPKSFSIAVAPTANSAGKTVLLGLYDPFGGATTDPTLKYATLILAGGGGDGHAGFVAFDEHDYVALAAAGKAVITVERGGGASGAVSINYSTQDGTAVGGRDYTPASGTLQWNDGEEGLKTFFVPLFANGVGTVKLALSNPQGGVAIYQEHGAALLGISGHGGGGGSGAGAFKFTEQFFQTVAGNHATITVERSGGHAGAVSVQYATGDGSGIAGTDYTPASGTLSWGPDEQGSKTFQVDTFNNPKGGGKSVLLALSNPTGGATVGDGKTSTLYVLSTNGDTSACVDDDTTLCAADGRFKVRVTWRTGQGQTGPGHVAKLNANAGAFWFFSADNTEMLVKVLDACNPYNAFWVFYAATTNVGFTVEVTDTHTGLVKQYSNPYGLAAPSVNDTSTFATCH
jgi:hypothetical protein